MLKFLFYDRNKLRITIAGLWPRPDNRRLCNVVSPPARPWRRAFLSTGAVFLLLAVSQSPAVVFAGGDASGQDSGIEASKLSGRPGYNISTLFATQPTHAATIHTAAISCSNPVACENQLPGDPRYDWSLTEPGDPSIQGFATDQSINLGSTVHFKINTSASSYHIDILRAGWYQGNGARKIASSIRPSVALPQTQPACQVDTSNTTGLIDCGNWAESASWTVPTTAVSGVYFAHLIRDDTGGDSYIFFDVRNDASHSDIIYQTSDTTREAYNQYGGNSLYTCTVACPPGNPAVYKAAYKVSFNRPNTAVSLGEQYSFFGAEFQMVEFLEANGYDVSYMSGVDTDRTGSLIKNHRLLMSSGHDEYWSGNQRANVESARDAGVNLAFFSGNEIFWKTRYENSIDGTNTSYRTLVTYKETHFTSPVDPMDPPIWTGTWRDPRFSPPADGGRPENALTGTAYTVDPNNTFAIQVPAVDGKMRFWRNTSVASQADGQTATLADGTLGYEWDEDLDNGFRPAGNIDLSTTTENVTKHLIDYGNTEVPGVATHHLTVHRASSGALVFGAGTVQWSWGLEGSPDGFNPPDVRMQQATINLLADMGLRPTSLIGGLTPATQSTDTTPPTSTITAPANGASMPDGSNVTITGTASDVGGRVGGVEVSVDGGTTWHPASGRENWTYNWSPSNVGSVRILSRATDDSANMETPGPGITVSVNCPCQLFSSTATPRTLDSNDPHPVELGMRFTSSVDGFVTGIRFYKAITNTGTHIGHVWTSSGQLLGSVTFSGESASGWQTAIFSQPIALTAGATYIVSYYAPAGHYSFDAFAFQNSVISSPPLSAPQSNASNGNGLYAYGNGTSAPLQTYQATNYWVDVIFQNGAVTVPPAVISQTPAPNSVVQSIATQVQVTFNKDVVASSIVFSLVDANANAVAGTLSYGSPSLTMTFTPNAALSPGMTYTASLSGVQDSSGNVILPVSWSFTTVACPCTLWSPSATPARVDAGDAGANVELGVRFTADVNGFIHGVRFYKSSANTGTHVGSLWSSSGILLAQGAFQNETASGWQQLNFTMPVAVTANTPYIVSYHTTVGHYSITQGYFAGFSLSSGLLHAPADGAGSGNGLYIYSKTSSFPNLTYKSTNYWVDPVFDIK